MKRVIVICFVLTLFASGQKSFGQTNTSSPPAVTPQAQPQMPAQKATQSKATGAPSAAPQDTLTHNAETPAGNIAIFQRIKEQELLTLPHETKNYEATVDFLPLDEHVGETRVRDTVVTIFPSGR